MKVINLFAGPGAGKSTTAAGLFHLMKLEEYKVELVTEYAKDITYENRQNLLADQLYITAKQNRRVRRLEDHDIDWAITDSPLILGRVYSAYYNYKFHSMYDSLVKSLYATYHNINFFIDRVKPYVTHGRNETENQAKELDQLIKNILEEETYIEIIGDRNAPQKILNILRDEHSL